MSTDAPTVYEALPMRVLFGADSLKQLAAEAERLGAGRVLVLSTPRQRDLATTALELLGRCGAGIFAHARMHVPSDTVAAATRFATEVEADACVAVGGGSTIGLAKALSLRVGLPSIAVPTTYAGSEMTPIWGMTDHARKTTGRDRAVLPRSVLYDPALTLALPARTTATSGLNAIAHAVEALYAPDRSPVVSAMAEQGVRALAQALPALAEDPHDLPARADALQGAWLCGACLGATAMGLHHKLCHVLGGMLDLPHAETHAVVLPHVAAFNLGAAPEAETRLRRALRTASPAQALADLARILGAPTSLAELGVTERDLPPVVEEVLARPYANPRPVTHHDLRVLLGQALHGTL